MADKRKNVLILISYVLFFSVLIIWAMCNLISTILNGVGSVFLLVLGSASIIGCSYLAYVTSASLWFYLRFKPVGARRYHFENNMLYIHSRFFPIPVEEIEYVRIREFHYRIFGFKASIKLRRKILRHSFILSLGGFAGADKIWNLYEKFIKDLKKRKIACKS